MLSAVTALVYLGVSRSFVRPDVRLRHSFGFQIPQPMGGAKALFLPARISFQDADIDVTDPGWPMFVSAAMSWDR